MFDTAIFVFAQAFAFAPAHLFEHFEAKAAFVCGKWISSVRWDSLLKQVSGRTAGPCNVLRVNFRLSSHLVVVFLVR